MHWCFASMPWAVELQMGQIAGVISFACARVICLTSALAFMPAGKIPLSMHNGHRYVLRTLASTWGRRSSIFSRSPRRMSLQRDLNASMSSRNPRADILWGCGRRVKERDRTEGERKNGNGVG